LILSAQAFGWFYLDSQILFYFLHWQKLQFVSSLVQCMCARALELRAHVEIWLTMPQFAAIVVRAVSFGLQEFLDLRFHEFNLLAWPRVDSSPELFY
jgi:hypothetical protein